MILLTSNKRIQLLGSSGDGHDFSALGTVLESGDERCRGKLGCGLLELVDFCL